MARKKEISTIFAVLFFACAPWAIPADAEGLLASDRIPLSDIPFIFDITVDISRPSSVLLATRAGLYRAIPDGTAVRVSNGSRPFWSVASHPFLPSVLFANGISDSGDSVGLLVSRDSGENWEGPVGDGPGRRYFRMIDVRKAEPAVIYGLADDLWASRDGGRSWTRAGPAPAWTIDIAVSSLEVETVYAATNSGVMVSDDGGRSWKEFDGETCLQPVTAVETGADGVLYAFSLCRGLLRADERTRQWVVASAEFGGCIIQHLAVDPTDSNRLYAVERCHKVLASADGGRSWKILGSRKAWVPVCTTRPLRARLRNRDPVTRRGG